MLPKQPQQPLALPKQQQQNSNRPKKKKKASSIEMEIEAEPDVIEISPPAIPRSSRHSNTKLKQVILREVIDVDNDGDSPDVTILDDKVDTKNKGKAIEENSHGQIPAKEVAANYLFCPSKGFAPGSHKPIIVDDSIPEILYDEYINIISDDIMDFDEYEYLQAHFDNIDVPPGVEAPIPSLLDSVHKTKKTVNGSDSLDTRNQKNLNTLVALSSKSARVGKKLSSGSSSGIQVTPFSQSHASGADLSSHLPLLHAARSKKKSTASQHEGNNISLTTPQKTKVPVTSSSSTNYNFKNQSHKATIPFGDVPSYWGHYSPFYINSQGASTDPFYPSFPPDMGGLNHPAVAVSSTYLSASKAKSWFPNPSSFTDFYNQSHPAQNPPEDESRTPKHVNKDDILSKYQNFKRFDTVEDHSDHYYASHSRGSSIKQPSKNWAKKIQEEWRILENDLPDTIFVRVYESRMDLLRAVIIGAEGTPYHDGLFFFDVLFPSGYPDVPPNVHYHSGGLRLNPNLYNCGKVCLSLLGTWHGDKNEKWIPGVSTVLQVLVSIQALVLNQKPFFNEPGFAPMNGSAHGESQSLQYNENTFMLSLKTMVYTMRRPPKHFEDFVLGHFHKRAHDIVVSCKAYMDGAQVGCLVKGGVQDVDEGDKSCSKNFKDSLPACVDPLLKEFSLIGVEDIEPYQTLVKGKNEHVHNVLRLQ